MKLWVEAGQLPQRLLMPVKPIKPRKIPGTLSRALQSATEGQQNPCSLGEHARAECRTLYRLVSCRSEGPCNHIISIYCGLEVIPIWVLKGQRTIIYSRGTWTLRLGPGDSSTSRDGTCNND